MKIIFLDIDGVLNSSSSCDRAVLRNSVFRDNPDPEHIKWLNLIIEKSGAKVVISSTWRKNCSSSVMWRLLDLQGFKGEVISRTPELDDIRGNEIRCWIDRYHNGRNWALNHLFRKHKLIESFVILDDDSDMGALADRLLLVKDGLTEKDALRAIDMLSS